MKKRIALISVLGTIFLLSICLGVANLFLIKDIVYASEVVFLTDSDETSSAMQNIVAGEQIELYLGVNDKSIPNEIKEGGTTYSLQSFKIADESIVKVEGTRHTLVPLKYGLTYASCEYSNGKTCNYNIIVHNDTEFVKDVTIAGESVSQTDFYVGEEYQLDLKVSSDCDFAQIKVSVKTDYEVDYFNDFGQPVLDEYGNVKKTNVGAEEFIEINSEGTLKVIGVGQCFVHIQSATNRNDPGVSFTVNSEFKDAQIGVAVEEYFTSTGDGGHNQTKYPLDNVYTQDDLGGIEELVFFNMNDIKESELHKVLPNVKEITFSLLNASPTAKSYSLSAGDIEYTIIGLEDKSYGFSVNSEGEQIEITVENLVLRSSTTTMQLNVTNATLNIKGKCEFSVNGNSNAITAENLVVNLYDSSNLAIQGGKGRNGTSSNVGGTDGYNAIYASGALSFIGANEAMATAEIFGGNGGNGAISSTTGEKGGNGGEGGIAVVAKTVICNGLVDLKMFGGNGGNGADGNKGSDGKDGPYNSQDDGSDGIDGSNGGDGGNGGNGAYAMQCENVKITRTIKLYGGDGGNAGNGGDGGNGGNGSDAGNWEGDVWHAWCNYGFNGGNGGDGGNGGNAGSIGNAAKAYTINSISGEEALFIEAGEDGIAARGGDGGDGGHGGASGYRKGYIGGKKYGKEGIGGNGGNGGNSSFNIVGENGYASIGKVGGVGGVGASDKTISLPIGKVFEFETVKTITDAGVYGLENQEYDTLNLSSLNMFMSNEYKFIFNVTVNIAEKNDGYQEIYLYTESKKYSGTNYSEAEAINYGMIAGEIIEHGPGKKDTESYDHSFSWEVSGNHCRNTMYIRYDAHGNDSDTWYRNNLKIVVQVVKA